MIYIYKMLHFFCWFSAALIPIIYKISGWFILPFSNLYIKIESAPNLRFLRKSIKENFKDYNDENKMQR